jgi:hypothetical protein
MVTKSFDCIEEVQSKVVAGVENGTQKLERTRDRYKRKVGGAMRKPEDSDLKMWRRKFSGCFRKRAA